MATRRPSLSMREGTSDIDSLDSLESNNFRADDIHIYKNHSDGNEEGGSAASAANYDDDDGGGNNNNYNHSNCSNTSSKLETFGSHMNGESITPDTMRKSHTLLSKITTIQLNDTQVVPLKNRRGLLSSLCLIPEYQDARELPTSLRRFIVFIIAFCAMLGPMGTSILLPASDDAVENLKTNITMLNIAIGVYLITLGVIPLWWSNFSERHGRRSIYIISFIMYLCFTIGCALAKDVNMLIGFRVLSGGCAASVQSVGAGTIGDLYPITKRGAAMGLFYLGPLAGPLLSPIIGGAITSNPRFGWRATQWFLICLSGGCCILIIFFLPETLRKQDNKDAIRKILRERLRNKRNPEDTESNVTTENKDLSDTNDKDSLLSPSNNKITPASSGTPSNANNTRDDNEAINEQEVERLNTLLSKISTGVSFGSRSRRGSFVSVVPQGGGNNSNRVGDNEENIDALAIDEDEAPVIDSVAPLSKVPTKGIINIEDYSRNKNDEIANELDQIQDIEKRGRIALLKRYTKIYLYGPLKAFTFMRYPPVFLSIAYSAPCFAALYVQNMTLTYMYSRSPYNFSSVLVGLVYIPNSVTYFIASIWGGKFNDYLLKKKIEKYGIVAPEARFGINVYVAAAMLPGSMLITGWCLDYKEQWVTPLVGTALFGFAQMIVIGVTVTYLADCLPGKGATGIALSNFVRMIMAAGVSFATEPLIKAMGVGPLFSMCAGITAVLSVLLVVIIRYGDHWRETYNLEKLYDIVDD